MEEAQRAKGGAAAGPDTVDERNPRQGPGGSREIEKPPRLSACPLLLLLLPTLQLRLQL